MGVDISVTGMATAQQQFAVAATNITDLSVNVFKSQGTNANLATEQANILIERTAFRANAGAFTVQNELVGELLNMLV